MEQKIYINKEIEKREEIASFLRGRCNFCVFWFVF